MLRKKILLLLPSPSVPMLLRGNEIHRGWRGSYIFFIVFLLFLQAGWAGDVIHYVGKSRFDISGKVITAQCEWSVTGQVVLFLSFSRESSRAIMRIKSRQTVLNTLGNINCMPQEDSITYRFPLEVKVVGEKKVFTASDDKNLQQIKGESSGLQLTGTYTYHEQNTEKNIDTFWQGEFSATLEKAPGELAEVSNIKGKLISTLPIGLSENTDTIADATTLITEEDSSATLQESDNTTIEIQANTLLNRDPATDETNGRGKKKYKLLRGKIHARARLSNRDLDIQTPNTHILPNRRGFASLRALTETDDADFVVEYTQDGLQGTTTVSVNSGSVTVTDESGNTSTVSAGETETYTDTLPRTSWVQPADGGVLYEGVENLLAWMRYPDAYGYIIEYNFPNPAFAVDNAAQPEFTQQTILLTPESYTELEDIVYLNAPIEDSGLEGMNMETRIYPVDQNLNILSDAVASDRVNVSFE